MPTAPEQGERELRHADVALMRNDCCGVLYCKPLSRHISNQKRHDLHSPTILSIRRFILDELSRCLPYIDPVITSHHHHPSLVCGLHVVKVVLWRQGYPFELAKPSAV